MSLSDSMLLEGYRDPREVWIALRSGAVLTRNNQTPAGVSIRGLNYDTNLRTDDIATVIEDLQTLSLL